MYYLGTRGMKSTMHKSVNKKYLTEFNLSRYYHTYEGLSCLRGNSPEQFLEEGALATGSLLLDVRYEVNDSACGDDK